MIDKKINLKFEKNPVKEKFKLSTLDDPIDKGWKTYWTNKEKISISWSFKIKNINKIKKTEL